MSTNDSKIKQWSTTPANNGITPNVSPNGWEEGMAPSAVNDTARQQMADHRYQWQDAEWFCWGDTVSKATGTTFKIATDVTSRYLVDRRVKIFDTTTKYATIISSSYSAPDTTIGLTFDTDTSLGASFTAVALAILSPINTSFPANFNSDENLIINGNFVISQRGTTFTSTGTYPNSDDSYLLDRWNLLSDGNDIVDVSKETTTVPTGANAAILLDVETANKKFGILQIIENKDAKQIIGGTCSVSFDARIGGSNATVDHIRVGVLSWSSTADTVTSDVVSAWNAEGADPTLVANWTYENTPADITLTSTYKTFKIENISIDTASTTNVALFIWCDNGDPTVGDFIYITNIKLQPGKVATSFRPRMVADELSLCQRFFQKTFDQTVAPAQATSSENGVIYYIIQVTGAGLVYPMNWDLAVPMRVVPTVVLFSPYNANNKTYNFTDSADSTLGSVAKAGDRLLSIYQSQIATDTNSDQMGVHATASSEL